MNVIGHAASLRLTPKNRFHTTVTPTHTPLKPAREDNGWHLTFKHTFGTTTSSANSFDANATHHTFVCCAGPAAIIFQVAENLHITQRLFRARPNVSPVNVTPSFYNPSTPPNTPGRSRQTSPLKDAGYGLGSSASLEHTADAQGQSRAGNRSRESTCVSLSHCGKFLAVGETGYNPRVILFSTASDAPSDIPLSILSDHSFGVSSVAFSPDSKWLCTLGNGYDGFVLIYSVNLKTGMARLHSSNKCSNVICVIWMGSSVVSIGIRHVKVWRLERAKPVSPSKLRSDLENNLAGPPGSPNPRTFSGRNCLLGELIDVTFTAAVAVSDSKAILCTAQGDICLLDDTDCTQRLERVARADFKIHCITFDSNEDLVWIAGEGGITNPMNLKYLTGSSQSSVPAAALPFLQSEQPPCMEKRPITLALGLVRGQAVSVDANRTIEIRTAGALGSTLALGTAQRRLLAHESAVLGVCSLLPKSEADSPDFFTFSAKGTVLFWLFDGTCLGSVDIPLDQPSRAEGGDTNEVKTVIPYNCESCLVTGDKLGILRQDPNPVTGLVDRSGHHISAVQAHNCDINGIALTSTQSQSIIATCGRDRTLQLFRKAGPELILFQTLDDHAAAIGDLAFLDGPSTLLSISADRTVIVRKMACGEDGSLAYIPTRVINLKASPVSFVDVPAEPNVVVISTMDRQIQRYDVSSGRLLHSFKASDPATGDSVIMSSLEVHKLGEAIGSQLLLGVSSTDKSIRIHDYDTGSLLAREYGQLAVSAIKLIQEPLSDTSTRCHLISCGLDGTIMTWELSSHLQRNSGPGEVQHEFNDVETMLKANGTPNQPLRRILSKAELSDFHRSLENDGDIVSPIHRAPSPSRVRRKISRFSLAATNKLAQPSLTYAMKSPVSPARGGFDSKSSQERPTTGPSPQNKPSTRIKPPSLDDRRRSKSTANLNDLNNSAEQICRSLQTFRRRIASAAAEKLKSNTGRELEVELGLTLDALSEKTRRNKVGSETIAGDLLNVYLAKMIDERLASRAKSEEVEKSKGVIEANEVEMTASEQERASELE